MICASWWPSLLKHSPEKNVFSGQFNTHGIVKTQALSWKDHGRACSVCDRDRPNAFPWRGRCHAKSVTDEVEGNSVVPTYGDNRSLRPHQSQLTLRQLPLQGKPLLCPISCSVDFNYSGIVDWRAGHAAAPTFINDTAYRPSSGPSGHLLPREKAIFRLARGLTGTAWSVSPPASADALYPGRNRLWPPPRCR